MKLGGIRTGRASEDVRRHNRAVVLELIRTRGPISRAELARCTGLSAAAIMEITGRLCEEGLVREGGQGPSTGGRPPRLLELVDDARYAIGVEMGTRTLTAVVTNLRARVRHRMFVPSRMAEGPEATYGQLRLALEEMSERSPAEPGITLGIGVAVPAPVVGFSGARFSPPSFPGWGELDVGGRLEKEYGLPVLVDNDANARAIGEHLFGVGQGVGEMLYVICHRGVGGAIIMDGDLRRGARGGAGEIGHTMIDPDGPRCGCGRYGCLEAFVGRAAIAKRARKLMKLSRREELGGKAPEEIRAQDVVNAALEGDALAKEVIRESGRYLGVGIANAVNAFDPELVVVGGSTAQAGDLLLGPAREMVSKHALEHAANRVRIVRGSLGEDAGAIGAAALVLRELFAVSLAGTDKVFAGEVAGVREKEA